MNHRESKEGGDSNCGRLFEGVGDDSKGCEMMRKCVQLFKKVGDDFERGAANLEGNALVDELPHLGTCASRPGESGPRLRLKGRITTATSGPGEIHDRNFLSRGESRQRLLGKRRFTTETSSPNPAYRRSRCTARPRSRHHSTP